MYGPQASVGRVLSTVPESRADSTPWWGHPGDLASRVQRDAAARRSVARYRFGDGALDIESNCAAVLDVLDDVYGECIAYDTAAPAARLSGTLIALDDPAFALITLHEPRMLHLADPALDLLGAQYLGSTEKFIEVPSSVAGWRLIAAAADPDRPIIAAEQGRLLIDLTREPPRFAANLLVSTVMRLQANTVFVHAASVAMAGAGVLLAGPSHSGKTTLSLALAARGHDFYGENVAALRVSSAELLPFRRTALLRPGARASRVDELLREQGVELSNVDDGAVAPKTPLRASMHYPPRHSAAVALRCAFFLERFGPRAVVQPFKLDSADFDTVLHPLSFDILVAASWGSSGGSWIMKHLQLTAVLGKVRCYKVHAGTPDETAELIEATVLGKPWDSP